MGSYNPDSPYVMGMQWPALVSQAVLLDTSSEVGYTFPALATSSTVDRARVLTTVAPPGQPSRKELLVNVYNMDEIDATGPIQKITVPCNSGSLGTGATLQGGAATVQAAVGNPSDAGYVQLSGASAFCRFWFDINAFRVQAAILNRRILDVSVLYAASGPFTTLSPALTLSLERPSATVVWDMDDTLTGPPAQTSNITPGVARLGELNPFPLSTTTPNASTERRPWRYGAGINNYVGIEQLAASGGTNIDVRITSSSAAAGLLFQLHYVALQITYCQENRVGAGGLDISAGAVVTNDIFQYEIPLGQMVSFGGDTTLTAGMRYGVTIGQSYSGAISVRNAVPISVNTLGSIDTFPTHHGVLLRKTLRSNSTFTEETTDDLPAVVFYTGAIGAGTVITSSHPYTSQVSGPVTTQTDVGDEVQYLVDDVAATYVWVIFYARRSAGTLGYLTVQQVSNVNVPLGPQASISVAAFDELPELINGWKRVQLRLSASVTTAGSGLTYWAFTADTALAAPWQVLGAAVNPRYTLTESANLASYGGETAYGVNNDLASLAIDFTLMIAQEMDTVTGLAAAVQVQALSVLDECCDAPIGHIPTGIYYHALSWTEINSGVVAGWAYYEVQRRDTTMPADEWETIAQITAPNVGGCADYEARVGVVSTYRIRMVHRSGVAGPWSTTVTSTIPAPGVTGTDVSVSLLVYTSNDDPAANLAYVMEWPAGQAQEDFTFFEGTETDLQPMYLRDFQTAFRPLERGGVQFTRTLLINRACIPTSTMDSGFDELRDLAWDTIPYVTVRDELSNRWLTTCQLPSATVRRIRETGHLMVAPLTMTEVTDTPAPLDVTPACEGLTPAPSAASHFASTPLPAAVTGTTIITDTFTRTVANGWGTADTGQTWSINGTAADFAVAAGVGTHSYSAANLVRLSFFNTPTIVNCQCTVRVAASAVSLGAPGRGSIVLRDDGTGNNHYRVEVIFGLLGVLNVRIVRRSAGVATELAIASVSGTYTAGTQINITARIRGSFIEGKAWRQGDSEPANFQVSATDDTFLTAGRVGARSAVDTGNTNTFPLVYSFDNWTTAQYLSNLDIRVQLRVTADDFLWAIDQINAATFGGWIFVQDPGTTELDVYDGGLSQFTTTTASLSVVKNQVRWVRVTYEPAVSAGLSRARFYTSLDGSTYTLITTATATEEPMDVGAGTWEIATYPGVTVLQAQILSPIGGTTIASPNFSTQAAGTTSFTDAQGNLWTIEGEALCESS